MSGTTDGATNGAGGTADRTVGGTTDGTVGGTTDGTVGGTADRTVGGTADRTVGGTTDRTVGGTATDTDQRRTRTPAQLGQPAAPDDEPPAPDSPGARGEERLRDRLTWQKLTILPGLLALVLLGTWLWFRGAELDTIARNSISGGNVSLRLRQHIEMTVISTFFVLIIAIPLGIALTRQKLRKATPVAMAAANLGQAIPSLGLLVLLVFWLSIGQTTAIVGMVVYAVLPVLANTITGLRNIDPALTEAAKGIGMSPLGVLTKVELPLAVPLILAGIRNALVLNVGTATLATFIGGGGLGDLISSGITNQRMPVLMLGSILTVALALLVDWLASLVELLLRPRGLEGSS